MDLTKNIAYNGLTISGATAASAGKARSGYIIERINFSEVPADFYLEKRALADGMNDADVYLSQRSVQIDCAIFGSTRGDLFDRLRTFVWRFSPNDVMLNAPSARTRDLDFFSPTADTTNFPTGTYPDGIPMKIACRPVTPPRYEIVRDATGGKSGLGGLIAATAVLYARDPRVYIRGETKTVAISTSTATLTNRGTVSSFPVLYATLTSAGSSAAMVAIDGYSVVLNLATVTTGSYYLTYLNRTIRAVSGDTLANEKFSTAHTQQFTQVLPQSASRIVGANLTGLSSIYVEYTEAWL